MCSRADSEVDRLWAFLSNTIRKRGHSSNGFLKEIEDCQAPVNFNYYTADVFSC